MDDHNVKTLNESSNEWCIRLVNIVSYHIIDGFRSIFNEAWKLCRDNNEKEKYLMTFQNMISQIPHWNDYTVKAEVQRITTRSNCNYLEDLITCVHIIQLKLLTCVRVSSNQKKIDIRMPSVEDFIHKVYINIARKLYSNIYLYQRNISPIDIQKNNREIELIVNNCILNTIRDNIPIDEILRSYLYERDEIFNVNNGQQETKPRNIPIVANNEKKLLEEKKNEIKVEKKSEIKLNDGLSLETKSDEPILKLDNSNLLTSTPEPSDEITKIIENNVKNDSIRIVPDTISLAPPPPPPTPIAPIAPPASQNNYDDTLPASLSSKRNKLSFNDTITAVDIDGNEESMPLVDLSRMPSTEDFDNFNDVGDTLQILDEVDNSGLTIGEPIKLEVEEL